MATIPSDHLSAQVIESIFEDLNSEDEVEDEGFDSPSKSDDSDEDVHENVFSDDDVDSQQESDYYASKNGQIKWRKHSKGMEDISGFKEDRLSNTGVQFFARNTVTPFEAFLLFFDNEVTDMILYYTNMNVRKNGEKFGSIKEINRNELHAVIGLLLYWGVMKSSDCILKESGTGISTNIDLYRMAMCRSRFGFITRLLRFDDIDERKSKKVDSLPQVSELMKLVTKNFKKVYVPGKSVILFEHVVPFNGKSPFKSTDDQKKCGIKMANLVDAKSFYYLSCEISNKPSKNRQANRSTPMTSALNLIDGIKDRCRDVISDKALTSVALAMALKQLGLNNTGQITNEDKNVPNVFRQVREPTNDSMYGYTDELTLISHASDKEQVKIYLSNRNQDSDGNSAEVVIDEIKRSQQGIDDFLWNFGGGRKIKRWPLLIFSHLISIAQMNAHIVYNENTRSNSMSRSEFVRQLSLSLIKRHMESRSLVSQIIRLYIPEDLETNESPSVNVRKDVQPSHS